MIEITLPWTCRQGWIGIAVVTFALCLMAMIVDLTAGFVFMLYWNAAFWIVIICIVSEKKGWHWPSISCRCGKK